MKKVLIYLEVDNTEENDVMKRIMDTLDFFYYTYIYNKYSNEILLITKHGFATFRISEKYYKDPASGKEYGYIEIELTATLKQLPLLVMEVARILSEIGLYKNAVGFCINECSEQ
jgi:hypothetical protein